MSVSFHVMGDERASAYVALFLALLGATVVAFGAWRAGPEAFIVDETASVELARGQEFALAAAEEGVVTECTVAPSDGPPREVRVGAGFRASAWWSGSALVTCDRPVSGTTYPRFLVARIAGLVAGAAFVVVLAVWGRRRLRHGSATAR